MKIKSPETQSFINGVLNTSYNRDPIFPLIVAYAIAMKMPILHDIDTPVMEVYEKLDTNVALFAIDEVNKNIPFDTDTALSNIKNFYTWRYSVSTGNIMGVVMGDPTYLFTQIDTFVPREILKDIEKREDKAVIHRTLFGIIRALGEISEAFR